MSQSKVEYDDVSVMTPKREKIPRMELKSMQWIMKLSKKNKKKKKLRNQGKTKKGEWSNTGNIG